MSETAMENEIARLHRALIEIDTYLANDPDVWRIVSVAKAGDVLCDVLGAETIQRINAGVLRAALDQWMAPDTWRLADGSEVGIPEGTLIRCGIAKRSDDPA